MMNSPNRPSVFTTTGCSLVAAALLVLLLVSIGSCHATPTISSTTATSSSTAPIPLPTPINAVWQQPTQILVQPDPDTGATDPPAQRCDHAFHALPPSNSDSIWLLGGREDTDYFSDSWLLNVTNMDQLIWKKISYNESSDPVLARAGGAISFMPNGIHPDDHGLTALIFGGAGENQGYLDDVVTFNFATNTMRTIFAPSANHIGFSPDGPFARAFMEFQPLPIGYGSGADVTSNSASGNFFLFGGVGADDGIRYSDFDYDTNGEYIFNTTGLVWTHGNVVICVDNYTVCHDEKPLREYKQFPIFQEMFYNGTLDISYSLRPSAVFDYATSAHQSLLAAASILADELANVNMSTLVDDPSSCVIECSAQWSPFVIPPGLEGYRTANWKGKMYLYGGYECSSQGVQQAGGEDCFSNAMWILDYSTMMWHQVLPPTSDSPYTAYAQYWPSYRAYHTMVLDETRELLIVQGGAYQDSGFVWYYYSDVYAFDLNIEQFVPMTVRGQPPEMVWSAAAAMQGNNMYLFGGCRNGDFFNQLVMLRMNVSIDATNCYASGSGTISTVAGESAYFTLQFRETAPWDSNLAQLNPTYQRLGNTSTLMWTTNATYGMGLTSLLTAQIVSSTSTSGANLVQAQIVELGGGLYGVSYQALVGQQYLTLFIRYEGNEIPGSPFTVILNPQPIASPATTLVSGGGIAVVEKDELATITIQMCDVYGNRFLDSRYTQGGLLVWRAFTSSDPSYPPQEIPITATDLKNGNVSLQYTAPSDNMYYLNITLNGQTINGSPFQVQALASLKPNFAALVLFRLLAALLIVLSCVFSYLIYRFRTVYTIRTSSPNFMQLILLGCVLTSLSVIFNTISGESYACQSFHSFLSIGLIISMTSRLAKSHRVMKIFKATRLRLQVNLDDAHLFMPTAAAIGVMVLLNIIWVAVNPVHIEYVRSSDYPDVLSFPNCSSSNLYMWIGILLVFCGVVMVYSVYIAVKTGDVPQAYNESKLIAASVYNVFFCSVIAVPLSFFLGSSSEFITGKIILQCSFILWCTFFDAAALVVPKLWILWETRFLNEQERVKHCFDSMTGDEGWNYLSNGDHSSIASQLAAHHAPPFAPTHPHPAATVTTTNNSGSAASTTTGPRQPAPYPRASIMPSPTHHSGGGTSGGVPRFFTKTTAPGMAAAAATASPPLTVDVSETSTPQITVMVTPPAPSPPPPPPAAPSSHSPNHILPSIVMADPPPSEIELDSASGWTPNPVAHHPQKALLDSQQFGPSDSL